MTSNTSKAVIRIEWQFLFSVATIAFSTIATQAASPQATDSSVVASQLSTFEQLSDRSKIEALFAVQQYAQDRWKVDNHSREDELNLVGSVLGTANIALSLDIPNDVKNSALVTVSAMCVRMKPSDRARFSPLEPKIRNLLLTDDLELRNTAIQTLKWLPDIANETVDDLLLIMAQNHPRNHLAAITTLLAASRNNPDTQDDLLPLFRDSRVGIRRIMAQKIVEFPHLNAELMTQVRAGCRDSDAEVLRASINAFTYMPYARKAIGDDRARIKAILYDASQPSLNRLTAAKALERIAAHNNDADTIAELRRAALDQSLPLELRIDLIRSLPFAEGYTPDTRAFLENIDTSKMESQAVLAISTALRRIEKMGQMRQP